jgi:hypothetical protein
MPDVLFFIGMALNLSWAAGVHVYAKGTGLRSTSVIVALVAALIGMVWHYMPPSLLRMALAPLWGAVFLLAGYWFIWNNRQGMRNGTVHPFRNPIRVKRRELARR